MAMVRNFEAMSDKFNIFKEFPPKNDTTTTTTTTTTTVTATTITTTTEPGTTQYSDKATG